MTEYEVVCVDHVIYPKGGGHIIRLGIRVGNSTKFMSRSELVLSIQNSKNEYYVEREGHKAYLRISISEQGNPFVETIGDDTKVDNLDLLPNCKGDIHDKPHPHFDDTGDECEQGGEFPEPQGPDSDVDQPDGVPVRQSDGAD